MADYITGIRRGGGTWTPRFIEAIDQKACIGCGRCYKVCGHEVLTLVGLDEDGGIVDAFDDEAEKKVMNIANQDNCIGCESCAKVCGKSCYTHAVKAA